MHNIHTNDTTSQEVRVDIEWSKDVATNDNESLRAYLSGFVLFSKSQDGAKANLERLCPEEIIAELTTRATEVMKLLSDQSVLLDYRSHKHLSDDCFDIYRLVRVVGCGSQGVVLTASKGVGIFSSYPCANIVDELPEINKKPSGRAEKLLSLFTRKSNARYVRHNIGPLTIGGFERYLVCDLPDETDYVVKLELLPHWDPVCGEGANLMDFSVSLKGCGEHGATCHITTQYPSGLVMLCSIQHFYPGSTWKLTMSDPPGLPFPCVVYIIYNLSKILDTLHTKGYLPRSNRIEKSLSKRGIVNMSIWSQFDTSLYAKSTDDLGLVHMDLKANNILMDKNANVKLIDFDCSRFLHNGKIILAPDNILGGTPGWIAPECADYLLDGIPQCNCKLSAAVDVWSTGMTLLEYLTGDAPHRSIMYMNKIYSESYSFLLMYSSLHMSICHPDKYSGDLFKCEGVTMTPKIKIVNRDDYKFMGCTSDPENCEHQYIYILVNSLIHPDEMEIVEETLSMFLQVAPSARKGLKAICDALSPFLIHFKSYREFYIYALKCKMNMSTNK